MFLKKKILAIVIARGGSKGIKLKNLKKINKKSLIWHVGNIIKKTKVIDSTIISTDHKKIASEAKKASIHVPFLRPKKLSGDKVSDVDVLYHATNFIEKKNKQKFDIVLMLQPTSPLRKPRDIIESLKILIKKKADSVWTISKTDTKFHPDKQLVIKKNKIKFLTKKGSKIIARQQLFDTYHKNGLCYAINRDCLINNKSIMGKKCLPLFVKREISNIDTLNDLELAKYYFKKKFH